MRIIIIDFISLDGVVQSPGGQGEDPDGGFRHGGWSGPYFDEDAMGSVIGEVMDQSEALLFGRRTWDVMASAWPDRAGDPFANQMNAIAKYVVSRTLTAEEASSRWNKTTLIGGDDAIGAIRQLRDRDGDGAIQVWGSASLALQLLENDLVDEYRLMLEPILLGGGKTIFPPRWAGPAARVGVGDAGQDRRADLRLPPRGGMSSGDRSSRGGWTGLA